MSHTWVASNLLSVLGIIKDQGQWRYSMSYVETAGFTSQICLPFFLPVSSIKVMLHETLPSLIFIKAYFLLKLFWTSVLTRCIKWFIFLVKFWIIFEFCNALQAPLFCLLSPSVNIQVLICIIDTSYEVRPLGVKVLKFWSCIISSIQRFRMYIFVRRNNTVIVANYIHFFPWNFTSSFQISAKVTNEKRPENMFLGVWLLGEYLGVS